MTEYLRITLPITPNLPHAVAARRLRPLGVRASYDEMVETFTGICHDEARVLLTEYFGMVLQELDDNQNTQYDNSPGGQS